jgi:hypothetical protein
MITFSAHCQQRNIDVTCFRTQVKANEVGRACGTHGRGEKIVQGFDRKARRKGPLGRARRRWKGGIRMYFGEIGFGVWIGFDWLRIGTSGGLL